ncbi:uncharacterized protein LOC119668575 [Teleopsis dalmanni]|uniref:uncharacterized protein LOC119668575 n=1 Tax=Teleopsis dalmanni TaxID=139649 RepID=UPI0018CF7211|nr:uncharacterized protein LOC119668575 [Teleopsis dalmanni]
MAFKQFEDKLNNENLINTKYIKEDLTEKWRHIVVEYQFVQNLFEDICRKYFRLQLKKNQEIQDLNDALNYACDCIITAQTMFYNSRKKWRNKDLFYKKLSVFIKSLQTCKTKYTSKFYT